MQRTIVVVCAVALVCKLLHGVIFSLDAFDVALADLFHHLRIVFAIMYSKTC